MTVSVIIATYNRASLLAECLAHLARQPFAAGDEIIVVDNGSTDRTSQAIEESRRSFDVAFHHLEEAAAGKSHAVARALAHASGEVLALLDDDVNVEDGWLAAVRRSMDDRSTALAGGPVVPRWERPAPRWLRPAAEQYGRLASPLGLLSYGRSGSPLGPRTVLGANLVIRRDVMARMGGYATHLGKLRGTLLSGEDHDLCVRVQAAGLQARYCPDLVVRHWVPADRMRLGYSLSWFFWSGITHATIAHERMAPAGRTFLRMPLYLLKRAAAAAVGCLACTALGRTHRAVEHAVDVAFVSGYAARQWNLAAARQAPASVPVESRA